MTEVLERSDAVRSKPGRKAPAPAPKPSRIARWRVSARLAARQVRRTWVSSLLILLLIALPIAGMSAVAVYVGSMFGTVAEKADAELGQMQAWLQPAGVPGAGMWQVPDNAYWTGYPTNDDGSWTDPEGEIPADPLAALPSGTEVVKLSSSQVKIDTATGIGVVDAWGGPVADPRFAERFVLVDGRAPQNDGEVLVTPATLTRAGTAVGGTLSLAGSGEQFTVTGTFDAVGVARDESAVAFFDADRFPYAKWYLPDFSPSWADVQDLNAQGIAVYSRQVVLDPPPFSHPVDGITINDAATQELLSLLALAATLAAAGVAAGYMVVMLAGAAFAVSARRQQRALAIAASVGADAKDLRRTVRLQGTVLGLVAGTVGVALGIGVAAAVMAITDNGSGSMFWGFHVPWPLLAGILVFAVLVGTASALMPARGVAKSDTISALRGARRPQNVTAARPIWGSVLLVVGVAITILCGIAAAAVVTVSNETIPWDSPVRWLPTVGIILGPIIAQLGIILSGRWLLWLASRGLSRLGIAARIASRDAVANGARTVPAFAAIGATVFVGVFAVGLGTLSAGQTARAWTYPAPVGTAVATVYAPGVDRFTPAIAAEAGRVAAQVLTDAGAVATAPVDRQDEYWVESQSEIPADLLRAVALTPERNLLDPEGTSYSGNSELRDPRNNLSVIDVDGIETATGIRLTAAQRQAYEDGAALVTDTAMVTDGTIEVAAWTEREWSFGGAPTNVFAPMPGDDSSVAPQWARTLDAIVVDAPHQGVLIALAPATSAELGLQVFTKTVFGTMPAAVVAAEDRLYELTEVASTPEYGISAWISFGPSGPDAWLVPLLIAVAVLVLGASAVALGLARFERRPDDATLAAVGGTAGLRRRIGFWQGLVIAGFGTFAGAVAGILPPIGFWLPSQTSWQGQMNLADIPWALLLALAVALPVTIALVNWVVPPREPELTRRSAIA